jgi:hypothetical protein
VHISTTSVSVLVAFIGAVDITYGSRLRLSLMGQLLSRQATPVKQQQDLNRHALQSSPRRYGRSFEARVGSDRLNSSVIHRNDGSSSRKRNKLGAQGNSAYSQPSKEAHGNVGAPRRQQKYVRGQALSDQNKVKDATYQRTRKSNPAPSDGKTRGKNSRKTRLPESKSASRHTNSQATKECIICTDIRSLQHFPDRRPTEECTHEIDVCRRCLRKWIQSEFSTKMWNEINCPICTARMQHDDIRAFAPHQVFRRYVLVSVANSRKFKCVRRANLSLATLNSRPKPCMTTFPTTDGA